MNLTLHDLLKQKAEGMVDIILVKYRAICFFFIIIRVSNIFYLSLYLKKQKLQNGKVCVRITGNTRPIQKADFCNEINRRRELLLENPSEMDAYLLSFDAHNILVSIHPWVDGNGRMSRLIMNHLQFEFNLVPTKVMTDDKAAYIEALNASREEESMLPFRSFMLQEHIKNLKAEIEQYERSMDDDVVINVGKDFKNVGKEKQIELSERQQNIISVVKHHPEITIPELAQRMSGKKTVTTRTIERDIAALQAKGILKREGGRKSGKWIVVNI